MARSDNERRIREGTNTLEYKTLGGQWLTVKEMARRSLCCPETMDRRIASKTPDEAMAMPPTCNDIRDTDDLPEGIIPADERSEKCFIKDHFEEIRCAHYNDCWIKHESIIATCKGFKKHVIERRYDHRQSTLASVCE